MGVIKKFLQNNVWLQYLFAILPLIISLLYVFVYMTDLSNVYYTYTKNAEILQQSLDSEDALRIKSYKLIEGEDNSYILTLVDDTQEEVHDPVSNFVMGFEYGAVYYDKEANALITNINKDYASTFIIGSNLITVMLAFLALMFVILLLFHSTADYLVFKTKIPIVLDLIAMVSFLVLLFVTLIVFNF